MQLVINGQVQVGQTTFIRIDDLELGRVGYDMLTHPFALVLEHHDAEFLIKAVEAHLSDPSA